MESGDDEDKTRAARMDGWSRRERRMIDFFADSFLFSFFLLSTFC
jgi:hypothetical protein